MRDHATRPALLIAALAAGLLSFAPVTRAGDVRLDLPAAPVLTNTQAMTAQKVASTETLNAPGTASFTVTISNTGSGTLKHIRLTETLPTGFTYAKSGTAAKMRDLGDLGAGTSMTYTYTTTVAASVKPGRYPNETVVSADGVDPIEITAPIDVTVGAVLGAEDELVASGPSLRDFVILVAGTAVLSVGLLLMRRQQPV